MLHQRPSALGWLRVSTLELSGDRSIYHPSIKLNYTFSKLNRTVTYGDIIIYKYICHVLIEIFPFPSQFSQNNPTPILLEPNVPRSLPYTLVQIPIFAKYSDSYSF